MVFYKSVQIIWSFHFLIHKLKIILYILLNFSGTVDQLICLKITLQLIPSLCANDVVTLIKIITETSHQHNNDHRRLIYDIMSSTYEIYL